MSYGYFTQGYGAHGRKIWVDGVEARHAGVLYQYPPFLHLALRHPLVCNNTRASLEKILVIGGSHSRLVADERCIHGAAVNYNLVLHVLSFDVFVEFWCC